MVRVVGGLWLLALCGCNSLPGTALDAGVPPEADVATGECGPTLKPAGRACIPTLGSCSGDQVPTPGGGCRRIGVEQCKTAEGGPGIKGPPDWTCQRVGPPTTCLPGWAMTKHGWCEPVLPEGDCLDGFIEVIGKSTCQPMADCGSSTYGNIVVTADTVFVDQAYAGTDSDGSQAKPYFSISAALAAIGTDRKAHVAVAAGLYEEDLSIVKQAVVLEGRCPQMVTVQGKVTVAASEATLRRLTVRSPGLGVTVSGGVVDLDRVAVLDCKGIAVQASDGARVLVTDSVVARSHGLASIYVLGEETCVELDRTVVRDAQPASEVGAGGLGVRAKNGSDLTVRDSVVSGNHFCGVSAFEAKARIERSVIRRSPFGVGIQLVAWAEVEVVDSLVADNHMAGVFGNWWSSVALERTVVQNTRPPENSPYEENCHGAGICIIDSSLALRDSVVASNTSAGVVLSAADAIVERTLILDTLPGVDGTGGHGITTIVITTTVFPQTHDPASTLTLTDSIVDGNRTAGVAAYASDAKLERTLVQNTLPRQSDSAYGIGVLAIARVEPGATLPATLSIKDSTITGSAFSGLAVYGSQATVQTSVVRDTREPKPRRWGGPGVLVSSLGKTASTLELKESLVADSSDFGVFVEGSQATLVRSAIRDTRTRLGDKAGGIGVYAWPGQGKVSTKLQLHDCQVSKSGTAGIYVSDAPLDVQRCQVTTTAGDSEGFGDGIMAEGDAAKLNVLDSLVSDSLRCGLLSKGASGLMDRSMLTKGEFSVVVESGALDIGPRVELSGNTEDRVTFGENIGTPTPPMLPPPPVMPAPVEPPPPEPDPEP